MSVRWYALVDHEVVGPFTSDDEDSWRWYHEHAGPDWRARYLRANGVDPWEVDVTDLGDGRWVSTVFLGLDHWWAFGDLTAESPPAVFETMVLPACDMAGRWSTWDQATAGHWQAVADAVVMG